MLFLFGYYRMLEITYDNIVGCPFNASWNYKMSQTSVMNY